MVDLRGDRCPSVGSSDDRPRGIPVAVRGEIQWPPMGTFSWPPSLGGVERLKCEVIDYEQFHSDQLAHLLVVAGVQA